MSELVINSRDNHAELRDNTGDRLIIEIYSNGQTVLSIEPQKGKIQAVLLSNEAAHQLRDMLNRRFPRRSDRESDQRVG